MFGKMGKNIGFAVGFSILGQAPSFSYCVYLDVIAGLIGSLQ